ncbi:Sterol desaturase/sphingolipid hydroxylase, fatty acid hydroxylase superfamily [Spirosomataceae bacterium TFI 002]|nr:Sterol desaturase/sphingolipid hydroxylase, fatty acid hydroxylase superfamily [Spirosomataceae bacterium TFI 002]
MNFQSALHSLQNDQLLFFAIPVFLLSVAVEYWFAKDKFPNLYAGKDFWVSIAMGVLSGIVEFLPKVFAFIAFYYLHEITPLKDIIGRQWWAWVLLFFADDLSYYWFHRLNHEVRLFWAGHVPHHSSTHYNLGTALRQGVGERIHKFFFWLWLPLLGFDPLMIFTMISVSLVYQFFVHTEVVDKLPSWYEAIFNTPSHHRVHHASNIRYLDCNHAGVLIIWDKLFGTFSEELEIEKPVYGLTENINTYQVAKVATHEYGAIWNDLKKTDSLANKLRYIFKAPGWSHDGEDKRAKTLRKQI